jgi:hypothetical protein
MNPTSLAWLNVKYPQNYIIRKPLAGTLLVVVFCYLFTMLYRPGNTHSSEPFSYEVTMVLYASMLMPLLYIMIRVYKLLPMFSNKSDWTFKKEVGFGLLLFFTLGVWNYFVGFVMENPVGRWNLYTFFDSVKSTFTVGIIPYSLFTIQNSKYLFQKNKLALNGDYESEKPGRSIVHINSKLKKGHLSFDPESFLYAESDGNYVNFYFKKNDKVEREIVRNSIADVENQLANIAFLKRTHRAFIVNLKMVVNKKGNSSGYRLHLDGVEKELPVSRKYVVEIDQRMENLA